MWVICQKHTEVIVPYSQIWAVASIIDVGRRNENHEYFCVPSHPYDINCENPTRYKYLANANKCIAKWQPLCKNELFAFKLDDEIAEASKRRRYIVRYDTEYEEGKFLRGCRMTSHNSVTDAVRCVNFMMWFNKQWDRAWHEYYITEELLDRDAKYRDFSYASETNVLGQDFILELIELGDDKQVFDAVEHHFGRKTC